MTTGPGPAYRGLPIAEPSRTLRAALRLIRLDGRVFAAMIGLNALAAAAGLVGPWLLGRIVDEVGAGAGVAVVDRLALTILVFAVAQLLLVRWAGHVGHRFGERTLARIREEFTDRTLALPAPVVERAGTGDLLTRGTTDVASVGATLRDTGPEVLIAAVQALFVLGAVFALDPLLGACGVLGLLGIWFAARWYLRRALTAYLAEGPPTRRSRSSSRPPRPGPAPSRRSGFSSAVPKRAMRPSRSAAGPGPGRCSCAVCSFRPWTSRTSFRWPVSCWPGAYCTTTAR